MPCTPWKTPCSRLRALAAPSVWLGASAFIAPLPASPPPVPMPVPMPVPPPVPPSQAAPLPGFQEILAQVVAHPTFDLIWQAFIQAMDEAEAAGVSAEASDQPATPAAEEATINLLHAISAVYIAAFDALREQRLQWATLNTSQAARQAHFIQMNQLLGSHMQNAILAGLSRLEHP